MTQLAIVFFSGTAIFLVGSKHREVRRWGYLFGMAPQPLYFHATYIAGQWGMFLLAFWFTFGWTRLESLAMIYFVNWDGDMSQWPSWYGILRSPRMPSTRILERSTRSWCGDNDAFHGLFSSSAFRRFLDKFSVHRSRCKFIACPDVVGNATETSALWREYSGMITMRSYPAAFVLQDGHEPQDVPQAASAIFVGGSTAFKFSRDIVACITASRRVGRWIHVGRVNSQRRLAYFASLGADSADGTTINRAPEIKRRMLDSQLRQRALPIPIRIRKK